MRRHGFLLDEHPFLRHYLRDRHRAVHADRHERRVELVHRRDRPAGRRWPFDLSAYAGKQVEVSISYVTDPFTGGVGAFVDDTRITTSGGVIDAEGFETGLGVWSVGGPPAGSPPNSGNWEIGPRLVNFYAGTSTEDTLLLGFGIEQLATEAERADLVEQALDGLID